MGFYTLILHYIVYSTGSMGLALEVSLGSRNIFTTCISAFCHGSYCGLQVFPILVTYNVTWEQWAKFLLCGTF